MRRAIFSTGDGAGGNFGGEFTESRRRAGGQIGRAGRRERFHPRSCYEINNSRRSLKNLGGGSIAPPDFKPSAASFFRDSGRFCPSALIDILPRCARWEVGVTVGRTRDLAVVALPLFPQWWGTTFGFIHRQMAACESWSSMKNVPTVSLL